MPGLVAELDLVEVEIGAFPMVLRVFLEAVGTINLNGTHPRWTFDYPDPFCVEYHTNYAIPEHRGWKEDDWFARPPAISVRPRPAGGTA